MLQDISGLIVQTKIKWKTWKDWRKILLECTDIMPVKYPLMVKSEIL